MKSIHQVYIKLSTVKGHTNDSYSATSASTLHLPGETGKLFTSMCLKIFF